jgi:hypothetical protein
MSGYASGDGFEGPGTGAAGAAVDGGPLDVSVTWDGVMSSAGTPYNGAITDHTGDSAGMIAYDDGESTMTIEFSKPVEIPSFYYSYYDNSAGTLPLFQAYTHIGDAIAVDTFAGDYPGGAYNWQQETGFGGIPVQEVKFSGDGGDYLSLDDIAVTPEPSSIGLLALGAVAVLRRRRA